MVALVHLITALSGTLVVAAPAARPTADLPNYTYNWTGIDNHLNFQPTSNGYSVTFAYDAPNPNNVGDFAVGRGWSTGTDRNINFSGSTTASTAGNVFVQIYGFTSKPKVEYSIREYSNRVWVPQGQMVGSLESDGSVYDIFKHPRVPQPGGVDTEVLWQYYSVRRDMRPAGGTVTTANHFAAWAEHGMKLGTMGFQILATEGYKATGSSNYTISA